MNGFDRTGGVTEEPHFVGDSVVVTVTGLSARKAGSARFAMDLIACSLRPSDDTTGPLRYRN